MTDLSAPNIRKSAITDGMSASDHISYAVTFVANLMSFGGRKDNVERFNLTVRQWRVIAIIGRMGPMTLSDIANTVHHEKSTLSRAAKELEKRGLLCKLPNIRHKLSPLISFTKEGQALYNEITPIHQIQSEKLTSILSDEEKKQLCDLLDKLQDHAEEVRAFEGWAHS